MKFLCTIIFFACASPQASIEPPASQAWAVDYNAHSTLAEYVAATRSADDDGYVGVLTALPKKPFEGYWLDDPIGAVAFADEYNVGTGGTDRPIRRAALAIADDDITASVPQVFTLTKNGYVIDRGWGFRVPDTIVHYVQAKDWW